MGETREDSQFALIYKLIWIECQKFRIQLLSYWWWWTTFTRRFYRCTKSIKIICIAIIIRLNKETLRLSESIITTNNSTKKIVGRNVVVSLVSSLRKETTIIKLITGFWEYLGFYFWIISKEYWAQVTQWRRVWIWRSIR